MPRAMPVLNAPRLRLWPPSSAGSKPARAARLWMIRATVPASIATAPTRGRGYCGRRGRAAGSRSAGTLPLGDPGGVLPGAERADRTKIGGAIGNGHGNAPAGALALAVRQGQAQAAFAGCQMLDPDGGKFGAPLSLSLIHATQQVDCFAARLLCLNPAAPGSV